jgi:hypothetical protein
MNFNPKPKPPPKPARFSFHPWEHEPGPLAKAIQRPLNDPGWQDAVVTGYYLQSRLDRKKGYQEKVVD